MARPKPRATPYDVRVVENDCGDGHWEIIIQPALLADDHRDDVHALADLVAGSRWVAGIASRAALALANDLEDAAIEHGCHRSLWLGRCGINGSAELIDPSASVVDAPEVCLRCTRQGSQGMAGQGQRNDRPHPQR